MIFLNKLLKLIFIVSIVVFGISYFYKDKLPDKNYILEELYQDPIQKEISKTPFEVEKGETIYTITPLYNYEIYGLVVSYHHSNSWFDYYHEKWKDFLNVKDVCVIWGDNIETEVYKNMKFKSGSFTCYPNFKLGLSQEIRSKYRNDNLSNNHLLSDSEEINKKIMSVRKGDQIYIKGYLVNYGHKGESSKRTSSTSRTDLGCECIYITDFEILKKNNSICSFIYKISGFFALFSFSLILIIFFLTPLGSRLKK